MYYFSRSQNKEGGGGVGVYYFLLCSGSPCLEQPSLLQSILCFCLAVPHFYKSLFSLSSAVSRLPKPHQRHWKLYAHLFPSHRLQTFAQVFGQKKRERQKYTVQRFELMPADSRWTRGIYHYHNYHFLSIWTVVHAVAATVSDAV